MVGFPVLPAICELAQTVHYLQALDLLRKLSERIRSSLFLPQPQCRIKKQFYEVDTCALVRLG
jgi:hypothetical protein